MEAILRGKTVLLYLPSSLIIRIMCRYGMTTYKQHYACFECRKTFKRKLLVDIDKGAAYSKDFESVPSKCPKCSALMANMGLDFESPKKNDLKTWSHMKNLYKSGITFHSCGCSGPGYIPKNKPQLLEFLNEKREGFIKHKRFWSNRIEPKTNSEKNKDLANNSHYIYSIPNKIKSGTKKNKKADKVLAVQYWAEKIEEIELQINKLNY
ncbi:hypothetical protein [Aquimarina algiphila]|uniref:hypothetical protein n=1 Tax=Aquimarina algiphila TaxID=2047982 RepID=UPI00249326D2|nr:hypothetical protein [Aquimarina algiphila]